MGTYYNNAPVTNGWPNGYNQGMDMNYGQQGLQNHAMAGPATNGMYAGQQNGHIPSMNSMNSMNSSTSYSNYQSNTTTNKPYQQQPQPYLNGTMPPPTRPNGAIPSGNGSNGGGNGTNPSDPSMFYYSPPHNQQNSQANHMPPQQQINGYHQQQSMVYPNYDQVGYIAKAFGYNYNNGDTLDWNAQTLGSDSMEQQLFMAANSGINFAKYEEIPVDVSPADAPPAIQHFVDAKLHSFVQDNVAKSGYTNPTPVQKHSIPTLLENRDLMSCAQTGSGKTAAFLLPIISHILTDGPGAIKGSTQVNGRRVYNPAVLVLSPTRELAIQIHKESAKFSYRTNLITAILYGGRENYREQLNRLRNGCHILIATPGRLIDVLEQGLIGLGGVRYLVLDEADRMLDMGFEPQIRKIVNNGMPPKTNRVTAMFSATFPKEIQILAQDFLKQNYVFLAVGRVGSTSDNIEQNLIWVEETQKRHTLGNILENEEMGSLVLIFVETKRSANDLSYFLSRSGLSSVPIHGDLKQYERERNLDMFKSGQCPVLVATAVAARGLDIPNVRHVINYDLPGDIDEYVHRIGRTGRCGNVGKATSFFNEKNRVLARDLLEIVKETHQVAPDWLVRIASESRSYGGGNRGGGYRGGNSGRFGGTDHRRGSGRGGFNGSMSTFNSAPSINTWNQPPSQATGGWQKSFGGGQAQGSAGGNGYGNSGFGKTRGGRGGGFNSSGNGSSSNYYGSGSRGGGTSYGGNQGFGSTQQSASTRGNHGYAGYSS